MGADSIFSLVRGGFVVRVCVSVCVLPRISGQPTERGAGPYGWRLSRSAVPADAHYDCAPPWAPEAGQRAPVTRCKWLRRGEKKKERKKNKNGNLERSLQPRDMRCRCAYVLTKRLTFTTGIRYKLVGPVTEPGRHKWLAIQLPSTSHFYFMRWETYLRCA